MLLSDNKKKNELKTLLLIIKTYTYTYTSPDSGHCHER